MGTHKDSEASYKRPSFRSVAGSRLAEWTVMFSAERCLMQGGVRRLLNGNINILGDIGGWEPNVVFIDLGCHVRNLCPV